MWVFSRILISGVWCYLIARWRAWWECQQKSLSSELWLPTLYHHSTSFYKLFVPRSVLFFSRPRSKGWPHHGQTFSIYLCPLSFWLTLPRGVLSTSWCCPSRPCVVFLACVHLTLFFALYFSPDIFFVSSWYDHSTIVSLLWQCLTVPSLLQKTKTHSFVFFDHNIYHTDTILMCGILPVFTPENLEPTNLFSLLSMKPIESFSVLSYQKLQDVLRWELVNHKAGHLTFLKIFISLSL